LEPGWLNSYPPPLIAQGITDTIPDTVNPTALEKTTWRNIGIAAAVVAGLVLLLTLLMISRIRVAVACIKVASQAVGAMPTIILYPLLPFVLEVRSQH
jgi:choline transporter-like protein 2/4/5